MKRIIPVVIAIIHKNNRLLLTERRGMEEDDKQFGRIWHFPGGALEFGEDLQQSLHREIKEELNVIIKIEKQLPNVYSAVRANWHGLLIPYLCQIEGSETITLNEESYQYKWCTREEILNMKKLPFVQEMANSAFNIIEVRSQHA